MADYERFANTLALLRREGDDLRELVKDQVVEAAVEQRVRDFMKSGEMLLEEMREVGFSAAANPVTSRNYDLFLFQRRILTHFLERKDGELRSF